MSFDPSTVGQLRRAFYEEAEEGLEAMENALLKLESGADDPELINEIFRATHSIKGGSGTFGMERLVEFSHLLETLLDQIRSGSRHADPHTIELLLSGVDQLRVMLAPSADPALGAPEKLLGQLEELLAEPKLSLEVQPEAEPPAQRVRRWKICIRPGPKMLLTGSDPLLLLRELMALGSHELITYAEDIERFEDLDPTRLDLYFDLFLAGEVDEEEIRDILSWGEDCKFELLPEYEPAPPPVRAAPPPLEPAPQPVAGPEPEEAPVEPSAEVEPPRAVARDKDSGEGSIRVAIDRVDTLVNMVGELVIIQSMLGQIGNTKDDQQQDRLRAGLAELERTTRLLQEAVMRVRMLPIRFALTRFPRVVHDLSQRLGKRVKLRLQGEYTELDKTVMEKIGDPLVHLVRNAIDHGLEAPAERVAAGKDEVGELSIRAYYQGGYIVIEVEDDGAGVDVQRLLKKAISAGLTSAAENLSEERVMDFLFHPGISTRDSVSELSGRGVGMDVVRRNIRSLGGTVGVQSTLGQGTMFSIRLPLTLAIIDGQLVRVQDQTYVIPLAATVETLRIREDRLNIVAGDHEFYRTEEALVPIVRLDERFGIPNAAAKLEGRLMTIVDGGERAAGLVVDELLGQQQVVVKSLETNFHHIPGISGATILGDGKVALIFDVPDLIDTSVTNAAWAARRAG